MKTAMNYSSITHEIEDEARTQAADEQRGTCDYCEAPAAWRVNSGETTLACEKCYREMFDENERASFTWEAERLTDAPAEIAPLPGALESQLLAAYADYQRRLARAVTTTHSLCADELNSDAWCDRCQAELRAAVARDVTELEYADAQRHPLAPPALTEDEAIDLMFKASHVTHTPWYVVYDGAYHFCDTMDRFTYYPRVSLIAQSHCPSCADRMTGDPRSDKCAACSEYDGQHADEAIRERPILYLGNVPQIAA